MSASYAHRASTRRALPAGIDLEDRAARMNEFWRALVDFQRRRTGRVRHDTHG
jgi:hypothetical protein